MLQGPTTTRIAQRLGAGLVGLALAGAAAVAIPASANAAGLPANCLEQQDAEVTTVTCTFAAVGAAQAFTVPAGVTSLDVEAVGGRGGASNSSVGGPGAVVSGAIGVTPGSELQIMVGGNGGGAAGSGAEAGWNGGGRGGICDRSTGIGGCELIEPLYWMGGGGGGATDVRTGAGIDSRIMVAAGGGGAGNYQAGGAANEPGAGASGAGGLAGTTAAGGAGGGNTFSGGDGSLGVGGDGLGNRTNGTPQGGGGGGGLYGGGGGGQSDGSLYFGGGGGGSSLVPQGGAESVADDDRVSTVVISYTAGAVDPACTGSFCLFTGSLSDIGRALGIS